MLLKNNSLHRRLESAIPHLQRFALSLTGPDQAARADDLVQDCLERALRRLEQFDVDTNLHAWLFTILKNLHIDQLRKEQRIGRQISIEDSDMQIRQNAPQPVRVELKRTIKAIGRLRPCDRKALKLVVVDGKRYAQVARELGVAEGTVKSRISRARDYLRDV